MTTKFSPEEDNRLKQSASYSTLEDLSKDFNRPVKTIEQRCRKLGLTWLSKIGVTLTSDTDIQKNTLWPTIASKLTSDEVPIFLYHWNKLVQQFGPEVHNTELLQIQDVAMWEIQINRLENSQVKAMEQLKDEEVLLAELKEELASTNNQEDINNLRIQINAAKANVASLKGEALGFAKEATVVREKKGKTLQLVKGTRDQRLQKIESKTVTYMELVKDLIENPEYRRQVGIDIEKMRIAAEYEVIRFSELHKYEDGEVDRPYLTTDTVKLNEQGEYT